MNTTHPWFGLVTSCLQHSMRDLSHPNFAVSSFPAKNLVENPKKLAVTWGLGTRFLGVSMDLIMDFQTINMTFLGGKRKVWKRLKRLYKEEAKKPRHLQGIPILHPGVRCISKASPQRWQVPAGQVQGAAKFHPLGTAGWKVLRLA